MEFFKYCKREHLEQLKHYGSIRIGTLLNYKTGEHGTQIGDPKEGLKTVYGTLENVDANSIQAFPILRNLIGISEGATIKNFNVQNYQINSEDFYIFSVSENYSLEAHQAWHKDKDAKYDACYKVLSHIDFFREISKAISSKALYLGFEKIHYYNAEIGIDFHSPLSSIHPAKLKGGKTYAHQVEWRAFWRPRQPDPIKPFTLFIPSLIDKSSPYAYLDSKGNTI